MARWIGLLGRIVGLGVGTLHDGTSSRRRWGPQDTSKQGERGALGRVRLENPFGLFLSHPLKGFVIDEPFHLSAVNRGQMFMPRLTVRQSTP